MKEQIKLIAGIAYIDQQLDELEEEFGELPEEIEKKEGELERAESVKNETEYIIEQIQEFVKKSKLTLVDLKNREEELSKRQFQVTNNKEFDAITNEIKYLKDEHQALSVKMRKEGMKEENLQGILKEQTDKYDKIKAELEELNQELKGLSGEQQEEVDQFRAYRDKIKAQVKSEYMDEYERIRKTFPDAAVTLIKGSCKGYKVPPQIIVEMRNNLDKVYFDENSGRMLIPEEIDIDDEDLPELAK